MVRPHLEYQDYMVQAVWAFQELEDTVQPSVALLLSSPWPVPSPSPVHRLKHLQEAAVAVSFRRLAAAVSFRPLQVLHMVPPPADLPCAVVVEDLPEEPSEPHMIPPWLVGPSALLTRSE